MRSILITGGSGFFSKAFVRRILAEERYDRVCIYSRGEYAQSLMRTEFNDDSRLRWLIGDVRDRDRLRRAMEGCETVIHSAALKRIEVGEYCADEVVKTNVLGAINVIEAAREARVKNVVALSTDKAASPVNNYGASKLMSEKLFLSANNMQQQDGPNFGIARYGNIFGSTGSVVPIWRAQLKDGKKLTVTDPDATRFVMKADEAVNLVLWLIGKELLAVPELPSYRVADLAEAMGGTVEIVGMKSGEKRHETMTSEHEVHEFAKYGKYWVKGQGEFTLPAPLNSDSARRMSVSELKEELKYV